jgi:Fic family protein
MGTTRESFQDVDDRLDELRDLACAYPDIWGDFLGRFELSWIYHENALEGTVLAHAEITSALKGTPISPETYGPIRNQKVAIALVKRRALDGAPISMDLVREIHEAIGAGDPKFASLKFRKDIPLHRTYFHEIAQPEDIGPRLTQLLNWAVENDPDDDEAVRFAANFHHEFMRIFPFQQHTGRTGRLLVNYILLRHGYMPVVFHATERQRYYDCLRLARRDLETHVVDMMNNCLENGVKFVSSQLELREKESTRRTALAS